MMFVSLHLIARRWVALRLTQLTALLLTFILGASSGLAQKPIQKPRVPPGVDPGGVAVAIIGSGIDYTRPEIAARLARDGEGELIGWDFVDNDRRPYDPCKDTVSVCRMLGRSALSRSPSSRLMIVRASTDAPQSMVAAVGMIASTSARVVVVAFDRPPPLQFLTEAARRHPHLVFVGASAFARDEPKQTLVHDANLLALRVDPDDAQPGVSENLVATALAEHASNCVTKAPKSNPNEIAACALEHLRDSSSPSRP